MITETKPTVQIENVPGIKLPFFNEVAKGESIVVAAVLKEIDSKQTPYAIVDRFKGDFIIRHNKAGQPEIKPTPAKPATKTTAAVEATVGRAAIAPSYTLTRSGTAYFPLEIAAAIKAKGKEITDSWDTLEFKFTATRNDSGFPSLSWSVEPRVEGDRVLSLLNS